jgi:dihydropyrimidinase
VIRGAGSGEAAAGDGLIRSEGELGGPSPRSVSGGTLAHTVDLLLRNGTIVTAAETYRADVGIEGGTIKQIGLERGPAQRTLDVAGKYLFPGGIDVHTHVELDESLLGHGTADDFYSSTAAAACGGVTTIVDYAFPAEGQSLQDALETWIRNGTGKAVVDYGLHPVIRDPRDDVVAEMADVVAEGFTSFKIFTTALGRFDEKAPGYLKAMKEAGRLGALVNVHCEDQCCIDFVTAELDTQGLAAGVRHYPDSRPRAAEGLAAQRAVRMAGIADAPVYLVHLSCEEALQALHDARARGQAAFGETRPLYLHLTRDAYEREEFPERYTCWPPLREAEQMEIIWQALESDVLQTVATDHISWSKAQKLHGKRVDEFLPGMANLETLLPMLYCDGVLKGRLSLNRFVEVTSTNPAKLFGLYPQKGTIAVGSDADLVVFDPEKQVVVRQADMHSRQDWELHEGFVATGWPALTISRGEVIAEDRKLLAAPGRGRLVKRKTFAG